MRKRAAPIKHLFDPGNMLFSSLARIVDIVGLSLLWVLLCIPVVTIGPAIMMKFVALLTKKYEVPTIASLNTIMVDGTGMCGACRVTVDGKTKFVCVDGPEFDAHKVDFDEMMMRLRAYN